LERFSSTLVQKCTATGKHSLTICALSDARKYPVPAEAVELLHLLHTQVFSIPANDQYAAHNPFPPHGPLTPIRSLRVEIKYVEDRVIETI
jgi:hypothetical protein